MKIKNIWNHHLVVVTTLEILMAFEPNGRFGSDDVPDFNWVIFKSHVSFFPGCSRWLFSIPRPWKNGEALTTEEMVAKAGKAKEMEIPFPDAQYMIC